MSENEKNVPIRRFKEFENAEVWEQRKFDEEVEFYSGLTYSPNDVGDNGTFVLRSSNVKNGEIVDADNVYVNSEIVNSSNVKEGDIIVVVRNGSRSLIGKHAQIKRRMDKTVIGAFMTGIRSNQSSFINALMDTQQFSGEVEKNLGATINQITNSMFREMRFMFPDIKEQNQIGNFFNNLDNLITLHQRKLEKMKVLKEAYLTDMFPAEGERKPKLRFAGFTDDWEKRKLGNIVDIRSGRDYKHLSQGEIPVYGTGGYMISVNEALSYKEDAIGIGRKGTIDKPHILRAPFWTVDTLFYVVPETNNYLDFIYDIFQNINWKQKDESTGVPSLSKTAINDTDVLIPEYKEQKHIGNFFQNLDNLITLHQRKRKKLQDIKKAYLNEMFI